jgi:curved DNA-binding protein CbpA
MPAASAASVAAELLAFHREPVLHRPRYLHGQQPLPPGEIVLRLALGRFPRGWERDLLAVDRQGVRAAALDFVRQVCLWERATHYQLLCVPPDAERDVIRESYQLLIALIHPDRREPGTPAWPTGCAQRVNHAYEVLADARTRAEYDAGLHPPGEPGGIETRQRAAPHGKASHRRSRPASGVVASVAKRAVIVAGVIVTLFVVQSWWVGGLNPEYSLLERALSSSQRWGGSLSDAPRFLSGPASAPVDTGGPLEPIREPKRLASLASWVPAPQAGTARAAAPVAVDAPESAEPWPAPFLRTTPALSSPREQVAAAESVREAPAAPPSAPPARLAAVPQPAAEPPTRLAQAGTAPKAATDAPTREQVEVLVALLVGYYDAGDSERLVGLIASDTLGWLQGMRTRNAFADFFTSTRTRKLRMERLGWRTSGAVAEARGEATVVAEYADGRPRLERRVSIEIDIAQRDGAARITRLVLFPNG